MSLSNGSNNAASSSPSIISTTSTTPVPIPSSPPTTVDSSATSPPNHATTSSVFSAPVGPAQTPGSPATIASSAPSANGGAVEKIKSPLVLNGFQARPAGLVNEGNTCYQNSVQQSLASAPSIISLLGPIILNAAPSPSRLIDPLLVPSLRDEALEPSNAALLPVTLAFQRAVGRQWRLKNDSMTAPVDDKSSSSSNPPSRKSSFVTGLGKSSTSLSSYNSKNKEPPAFSMSLRSLLKEMAKKYDQYDGYRQQDAHELLRHMLDSMSMEERDLIKVLQPPPPPKPKKVRRSKPASSPEPPPVSSETGPEIQEIPESERMIPFVDLLFGGTLVSAVVCEGCKHVSHTYEGFLDISLSLKEGPIKARRRDKFRAIFGGKDAAKPSPPANDKEPVVFLEGVHSDIEPSGDDVTPSHSRRTSFETDRSKAPSYSGGLSSPEVGAAGLKKRSSLSFGKKPKRLSGGSEGDKEKDGEGLAVPRQTTGSSGVQSMLSPTPSLMSKLSIRSAKSTDDPTVPPRPDPAQAAYIRRLLNGPNLPESPKEDPLEVLRQGLSGSVGARPGSPSNSRPSSRSGSPHRHASSHHHSKPPIPAGFGTGLMDALRRFTATEVLEDENAFACKTCWKYQTGRMPARRLAGNRGRSGTLVEEDEDDDDDAAEGDTEVVSALDTPSVLSLAGSRFEEGEGGFAAAAAKPNVPTISFSPETPSVAASEGADYASSPAATPPVEGLMSPASSIGASLRAPSPLQRSHRSAGDNGRASPAFSGYTTSDGETSQDEQAPSLPVGRPSVPVRRKSTHYVMRRAFKRYLIAKAPPIVVFHFKRFAQTGKSSALGMYASEFSSLKKMDDFISFPEILDIAPFMAPDREDYKVIAGKDGETARYLSHPPGDRGPVLEPLLYKLHAVVVHIGSSTLGGHYISYVFTEPGRIIDTSAYVSTGSPPSMDKLSMHTAKSKPRSKEDKRVWWFCSDQQVRIASVDEVLRSKAYLTFYERMD